MSQPAESKSSESTLDPEGLQKLRMLVQSLKKKYGESVAQVYSLEGKCRELTSENALLKQTQNALSQKFNETLVELHHIQEEREKILQEHTYSTNKADDSDNEVKALREQHASLLSSVKVHEEEAKRATDELQAVKLKETQLERVIQFLRKRSEESQLESNQITQELAHAQEQTHQLSDDLAKSVAEAREFKEQVKRLTSSHLEEREELSALQGQLKHLVQAFQEKSLLVDSLELECTKLKEALHDENTRYDTLTKEHVFLKQSMMRSVDEVKKDLAKAEAQYTESSEKLTSTHQGIELALKTEIDALKNTIQYHIAKEAETNEILSMKSLIEEEKRDFIKQVRDLKEQAAGLKADREEVEQRFKTAQQHLAKKVRETALGSERIETEKLKSLELQNQLNVAQIKISELKNSLEIESEHQKRALARESELLKNAEGQIARLEAKIFDMHGKLKEVEAEARDLEKLKDKWREAEKLFSQLGHFAPPAVPEMPRQKIDTIDNQQDFLSSSPHPSIPSPAATFDAPPRAVEQSNLFEEKKPVPRFKESFL